MKIMCALLLLAGASVVACGQSDFSKQTIAVNPPFTLTISYNQQNPNIENTANQIVKGDLWVSLRIRKTNITDHEIIKRSDAGGSFGYDYDVRDSNGNLVGPKQSNNVETISGGEERLRGTKDMVLQPGESKIDYVPLASWFDMSKPGIYTIQVSAHITNDPASDVVKSNIITITVMAPDPPADAPK